MADQSITMRETASPTHYSASVIQTAARNINVDPDKFLKLIEKWSISESSLKDSLHLQSLGFPVELVAAIHRCLKEQKEIDMYRSDTSGKQSTGDPSKAMPPATGAPSERSSISDIESISTFWQDDSLSSISYYAQSRMGGNESYESPPSLPIRRASDRTVLLSADHEAHFLTGNEAGSPPILPQRFSSSRTFDI